MKGKDKKMHVLRVFQLKYNMERKHLLVHKQDIILFQAGEVSYYFIHLHNLTELTFLFFGENATLPWNS